jgi:hypothetical protein
MTNTTPPTGTKSTPDTTFDSQVKNRLGGKGTDWVSNTLKNLRHMSPTSLKATLRRMRAGAGLSFDDAMTMEYRMSQAFIQGDGRGGGKAVIRAADKVFALAEKLGLDHQKLFDISSRASGQYWSPTRPVPAAPANRDHHTSFTAEMILRDLEACSAKQ